MHGQSTWNYNGKLIKKKNYVISNKSKLYFYIKNSFDDGVFFLRHVPYVSRNIRDYKNLAGVTLYSECCDVTYLSINNHPFSRLPIFNAWFYAGFSFIFCRTDEAYQEFDSTHSLRVLTYIFIKGRIF